MNVADWVRHRADWSPGKVAVHFGDEAIDYAALAERVERLAAALHGEFGIRRGERIAHLGLNSPDLLALLFACARIGAALVPLNWRLTPAEHRFMLADCAPALALIEPAWRDHIAEAAAGLATVALGAELDTVLARQRPDWPGDGEGGEADPLLLVYTSGTTGRPKGAVLSQGALFWNAVNAIAAQDLTSHDHVLTVLPMFHVGGMNIQTTPAIHAGATVTIAPRFDPGQALALIRQRRPSVFLAVPAVIQAMLAHPDWHETDLGCLRLVGTGSAPVPAALLRAFLDRGIATTQIYGLTESGPVAIALPAADAWTRIGSCGKAVAHCAARIVDQAGLPVPPGQPGEIQLRGPNLLSGYWNDPAASAAAFQDGWFRTGDIGHRDGDGYVYVDERKSDVVISGGENIYPAELENLLAEIDDLAEFAVVGRPDPRWGEVPVACVVAKPDVSLDPETVLARFEGRLARFKHPRDVVLFEALPRNAMGKVLKFELRAILAAGSTAVEKTC